MAFKIDIFSPSKLVEPLCFTVLKILASKFARDDIPNVFVDSGNSILGISAAILQGSMAKNIFEAEN